MANAGVDAGLHENLDQLFLAEPDVERAPQVAGELFLPSETASMATVISDRSRNARFGRLQNMPKQNCRTRAK